MRSASPIKKVATFQEAAILGEFIEKDSIQDRLCNHLNFKKISSFKFIDHIFIVKAGWLI